MLDFRGECRDSATHWIAVQTEEFKRLGVCGDWARPYTTMSFDAEAQIVREIGKFLMNGGLYRGSKPVLWSVVEKTALADAEVEYHDHTSTTIWTAFPVVTASHPALEGAAILIWTTTPWTIPGNRAIAYAEEAPYLVIEVEAVGEGALAVPGERLALAAPLLEEVLERRPGSSPTRWWPSWMARAFAGTVAAHPLRGQGYDFDVPLLPADYVTMEQGTGFVHTAPGHGADDYETGQRYGLEVPLTVDGEGRFMPHVPLFAGRIVYTSEGKPGDANRCRGRSARGGGSVARPGQIAPQLSPLLAVEGASDLPQHAAVVHLHGGQRAESQSVAGHRRDSLRPQGGQEAPLFDDRAAPGLVRVAPAPLGRASAHLYREKDRRAACAIRTSSTGSLRPSRRRAAMPGLPATRSGFSATTTMPTTTSSCTDVVEVWFDSGSTHSFVLEQRPELAWPADLYLEGSDQHRGWFHSSLLESAGTRGRMRPTRRCLPTALSSTSRVARCPNPWAM